MRRLDRRGRVTFVDIAREAQCPKDRTAMLLRLHARENGGDIVTGAAAFASAEEANAADATVGRELRRPGVSIERAPMETNVAAPMATRTFCAKSALRWRYWRSAPISVASTKATATPTERLIRWENSKLNIRPPPIIISDNGLAADAQKRAGEPTE